LRVLKASDAYGPDGLKDWDTLTDVDKAKWIATAAAFQVDHRGPASPQEVSATYELSLQPLMKDEMGSEQTRLWNTNWGEPRVGAARHALAMNVAQATTLHTDWGKVATESYGDGIDPYPFEGLSKKWSRVMDTANMLVQAESWAKVFPEAATTNAQRKLPEEWTQLSDREQGLLKEVAQIKHDARVNAGPAANGFLEPVIEQAAYGDPRVSKAFSDLAQGKSPGDVVGLKALYTGTVSDAEDFASTPRYLLLDTSPKAFSIEGDRERSRVVQALSSVENSADWDAMTVSQRTSALYVADMLSATEMALQHRPTKDSPDPPQ
jgi:hypothetical protein